MKFLVSLLVVLLTASPAFAGRKIAQACSPVAVLINPTDTQSLDCVNLIDNTATNNATLSTCHTSEDWFVAPADLRVSNLRVLADTAPGTTGGTDTRTVSLAWDPPGATALAASTVMSCTLSGTATTCGTTSDTAVTIPKNSPVTVTVSSLTSPSAPDASSELNASFCFSTAPTP